MLSPPSSKRSLFPITVPISKSYMLISITLLPSNSLSCSLPPIRQIILGGLRVKMLKGDTHNLFFFFFHRCLFGFFSSRVQMIMNLPMCKHTFWYLEREEQEDFKEQEGKSRDKVGRFCRYGAHNTAI